MINRYRSICCSPNNVSCQFPKSRTFRYTCGLVRVSYFSTCITLGLTFSLRSCELGSVSTYHDLPVFPFIKAPRPDRTSSFVRFWLRNQIFFSSIFTSFFFVIIFYLDCATFLFTINGVFREWKKNINFVLRWFENFGSKIDQFFYLTFFDFHNSGVNYYFISINRLNFQLFMFRKSSIIGFI